MVSDLKCMLSTCCSAWHLDVHGRGERDVNKLSGVVCMRFVSLFCLFSVFIGFFLLFACMIQKTAQCYVSAQ